MKRPYIACHMMTVLDGRIDCKMTSKMDGVEEYYSTLEQLNTPATLSGRVTAELEMAEGSFECKNYEAFGKDDFSKKTDAKGYDVVVDTKGSLLWGGNEEKPLIIVMSQKVSKEYIDYLNSKNISWIVCGEEKIDLLKASEILYKEFSVERMAVVGGGHINAAFLSKGLLDEVSILLAPGIDGRDGMAAAFDGLPMESEPVKLKLDSVKTYDSGAVWLRYKLK